MEKQAERAERAAMEVERAEWEVERAEREAERAERLERIEIREEKQNDRFLLRIFFKICSTFFITNYNFNIITTGN